MVAVGDFHIEAVCDMCKQCQSPNLKLESVECSDFEFNSFKHYELYCANRQQCNYAYNHGKESAK